MYINCLVQSRRSINGSYFYIITITLPLPIIFRIGKENDVKIVLMQSLRIAKENRTLLCKQENVSLFYTYIAIIWNSYKIISLLWEALCITDWPILVRIFSHFSVCLNDKSSEVHQQKWWSPRGENVLYSHTHSVCLFGPRANWASLGKRRSRVQRRALKLDFYQPW